MAENRQGAVAFCSQFRDGSLDSGSVDGITDTGNGKNHLIDTKVFWTELIGKPDAIKEAENLKGDNIYILGEIIHNESVIKKLKDAGIKTIASLDDVEFKGGETLLIRTHGEPKSTFDKAKELKLNVIDCTCPFVKQIQDIVKKHYNIYLLFLQLLI